MVYNSGAGYGWGGVSGVPGLGVSIPAQARPGSSSAGDLGSDSVEAWDNAGKSRLQLFAAKAKRHLTGKSSSPSPSSKNDPAPPAGTTRSTSSDSGWNPQSLSNMKKLEPIPRVIPGTSAERKASCASGSSSCSSTYHHQHHHGHGHHQQLSRSVPQQQQQQQQARHSSLTHSASVHHKQQQQQEHKALVRQSKSVAASSAPQTAMTTAQVHWSDDSGGSRADIGKPPPRRSAQHRQSCHGNLRCPAAAASHHQRLQRLHHMAKSESALVGAQPSSLPPNILLSARGGFIPRAPIPTPPPPSHAGRQRRLARNSPSPPVTDGDSVVHYEVLPGDRDRRPPCEHHRRRCDHRRRPRHGGGGGPGGGGRGHYSADNTFDSIEIPMGVGFGGGGGGGGGGRPTADDLHYKVLHDREGHYSYAYDTSLSPAFLIRYNDERPPSDDEDDADSGSESDSVGSSKAENIYEEIADGVRSRIGSGEGGGGRGGTVGGGGSGGGGSGTSLNSDSGVGNGSNNGSGGSGSGGGADRVNRRKFSSETLDFGPKSTHGRKISRFSNNSNGSRQSGDSATCCPSASDDDQDALAAAAAATAHHRSLVTSDTLWLKTGSKTTVSTDCCAGGPAAPGGHNRVHTMSDEAFSDAIRSHHNRVLSQLRLDQDECNVAHSPSPTSQSHGDRDSGIQDMSAKKSSLSKVRAMRLIGGLGGWSKSQKSTLNNNNVMKRCESLDLNSALNEAQQHQQHHHLQQPQQPASGLKGHLRRYSEAFRRRMSSTSDLKSESLAAAVAAAANSRDADEDPIPADESFNTLEPARRLRRSTITSRWENMKLDDDDDDVEERKRSGVGAVECDV